MPTLLKVHSKRVMVQISSIEGLLLEKETSCAQKDLLSERCIPNFSRVDGDTFYEPLLYVLDRGCPKQIAPITHNPKIKQTGYDINYLSFIPLKTWLKGHGQCNPKDCTVPTQHLAIVPV